MKLHIAIPATLRGPLRAVAERLNLAIGATMRVAFAWYAGHKGRDLPADTMTARAYIAPVSTASAKFNIPADWETAPGVAVSSVWVRALSEWLAAGTPTGEIARSRLHLRAERAAGVIPDRRRVTGVNRPEQKSSRKVRYGDDRRAEFMAEDPESRWPSGKSAADVRPGRITGRPTIHDPTEPKVRNHAPAVSASERVLAEMQRRAEPVDVPTLAMALDVSQSTIRGSLYRLIDAGAVTTPDVSRRALRVGGNRVYEVAP